MDQEDKDANVQSNGAAWRRQAMPTRVAVLEDDPVQLELVQHTMRAIGYVCIGFSDGEELLRAMRRETFDLLILDWQLPGISGPDVVLWVREHQPSWIPIIFVTSRSDERDIVRGFTCGADDYMLKPMRVAELIARVRGLLRRANPSRGAQVQSYGRYEFNSDLRSVVFGDRSVDLKDKEFALALTLFANLGRLMSRQHLCETVWGFGTNTSSRALDTLMSVLRTKLNLRPDNGLRLSAVYSVGYRLEEITVAKGTVSESEASAGVQ
jgi:DNA-binding response OmpR family regulator